MVRELEGDIPEEDTEGGRRREKSSIIYLAINIFIYINKANMPIAEGQQSRRHAS